VTIKEEPTNPFSLTGLSKQEMEAIYSAVSVHAHKADCPRERNVCEALRKDFYDQILKFREEL